jgi:hypothetical protein
MPFACAAVCRPSQFLCFHAGRPVAVVRTSASSSRAGSCRVAGLHPRVAVRPARAPGLLLPPAAVPVFTRARAAICSACARFPPAAVSVFMRARAAICSTYARGPLLRLHVRLAVRPPVRVVFCSSSARLLAVCPDTCVVCVWRFGLVLQPASFSVSRCFILCFRRDHLRLLPVTVVTDFFSPCWSTEVFSHVAAQHYCYQHYP